LPAAITFTSPLWKVEPKIDQTKVPQRYKSIILRFLRCINLPHLTNEIATSFEFLSAASFKLFIKKKKAN